MGGRTCQRPRLCTCNVVGCGLSTTWCQSLLKYVPGRLIPKAMYACHCKLDKSTQYLAGPAQELQGDVGLSIKHSIMESSSDSKDEELNGRDQQPTFYTDFDDQYDHFTPLHLKDKTTALENALYDLMYLCSAVTQWIISFSYDLNLVFESRPAEPDRSLYQLYSSIPPGPNMGHRKLSPYALENAAILAHESGLYDVLVNVQHFEQFPSLEMSRLQFLVILEDELHRIDAIWQAAWNDLMSKDVNANLGRIQDLGVVPSGNEERNEDVDQSRRSTPNKGSHVVVNTDIYFRSVGVSNPAAIAGSFLILCLNLLCGISQAQSRFVSESLSFMLSHIINDIQAPEDRRSLLKFPRDYRTILNHFDLDPHLQLYVCCPSCYTLYDDMDFPDFCTFHDFPSSRPCSAKLK
ncbi:hypothetical protein BKA83DRAFT_1527796 [Pisolithus microcarpus]|nr:hypothetical protein BKA83DRAFT_1527796 [Pisolithus microcarpus]